MPDNIEETREANGDITYTARFTMDPVVFAGADAERVEAEVRRRLEHEIVRTVADQANQRFERRFPQTARALEFRNNLTADAHDWETPRLNELATQYGARQPRVTTPEEAIAAARRWLEQLHRDDLQEFRGEPPPAEDAPFIPVRRLVPTPMPGPMRDFEAQAMEPPIQVGRPPTRPLPRHLRVTPDTGAFIQGGHAVFMGTGPITYTVTGGTFEDPHRPEAGQAPGVDIPRVYSAPSYHPVFQSAEVRKDYLLGMAAQDDVDFGGVFGCTDSPGAYAYLQRGG